MTMKHDQSDPNVAISEAPPVSHAQAVGRRRALWIGLATGLTALAMLGLTFASAPLYSLFCKVTGFGGTTRDAQSAPKQILAQKIAVRFDANVAAGVPLQFRPLQTQMDMKLGETGLAFFEVHNDGNVPQSVVASYNVTPNIMGSYFVKLECFCYTDQILKPGETLTLPVVFFVDPEMVKDREAKDTSAVTLSYTFFEKKKDDADNAAS